MIQVKFYRLDPCQGPGGTGEPAVITVDTDNVQDAFQAAVDDRGDWSRKMLYKFVQP